MSDTTITPTRVAIGTLEELRKAGHLVGKAGNRGICVFWSNDRPYALEDRCPHMGFPLHRGSVESGMVTCHWHHARFDLRSGGTLDPFADDVQAYPVEINDGLVEVLVGEAEPAAGQLARRLEHGLERGITLVMAKAVLGLIDAGVPTTEIVRVGVTFGSRYRRAGWGAGLTVLSAMAGVLDSLRPDDRALALVHGLAFVSGDTRGEPPRFPLSPLGGGDVAGDHLASWYRRFIETRSSAAAERSLATAIAAGQRQEAVAEMMFAAVTDHLFIDGGHTVDFTNKAFEVLDLLGWDSAPVVLSSLVEGTASARRLEEDGAWRHPHDLPALLRRASADLGTHLETGRGHTDFGPDEIAELGWLVVNGEPVDLVAGLDAALDAGARPVDIGQAVAFAAALRLVRFHVQNDHGDWDSVHHAFTAANAVHQALVRAPSTELLRGAYQVALRIYLDRFLNVPAARLPSTRSSSSADGTAPNGNLGRQPSGLDALAGCWDREGQVDEAGTIIYRHLLDGGDPGAAVAALGAALLREDAEFHWFQTYEAAVRQFHGWPEGREEGALILTGAARFLAAHTPTRRELAQVVAIATRLRRGEALFEEPG